MRYKKVYRDGAFVFVDPLTGAGLWDTLGSVASKLIPIGKKAAEAGVEAGAKRLGEHAATKVVDKIMKPAEMPVPVKPLKPLGDQIVKELSRPPPKISIEDRISRLLNE